MLTLRDARTVYRSKAIIYGSAGFLILFLLGERARLVFRAIIIRGFRAPHSSRVNTPSEARKKRADARARVCVCVHTHGGFACKSAEKQNCITSTPAATLRCWLQSRRTALEQRRSLARSLALAFPRSTIIVAAEAHRANDYAPILIS